MRTIPEDVAIAKGEQRGGPHGKGRRVVTKGTRQKIFPWERNITGKILSKKG